MEHVVLNKKMATRLILPFSIIMLMLFLNTLSGQNFYDIDKIDTVELFFAEPNWDYILDSLFAEGKEERLVGTAVINGVKFDSVGVRYKGQSSYHPDYVKNPLNIKLDYIIEDQLIDGCYGTLKLANVFKDPSFVREVLSYEIARKYMAAGQANFANVYINETLIGLYTNVQDVDGYFMIEHFQCSGRPRFKGVLGEEPQAVIWGYLGQDSTSYFENYEIESETGWSDLIEFLDTLNNNTAAVEEVLDIDRHLWMLAFDILMVNLDAPVNMAQNFYLFKDVFGRFNPIIWDLNENFGAFRTLVGGPPLSLIQMQRLDPFLNISNPNYPIINRIISDPTYQKVYIAHMRTMIEENFSNKWYITRALEIQDIIDSHVQADPNKFYTYNDFLKNINNSVGSGPQAIVGISELMDARIMYLASHPAFQGTVPVISNIYYTPLKVHPNTTVWFFAEVDSADLVMLGYRQNMVARFEKIQMFDDGCHSDGVAGDGVYGVSIEVGSGDINYYIYAENDAVAFSPQRAECEFYTLPVAGGRYVALEQNFPNPFKYATTFKYHIPVRSKVSLQVYDVTGRKVMTLVNEEKEAGSYSVGFSTNSDAEALSTGVYFAKLALRPTGSGQMIDYEGTAKLVLVR